MDLSELQLKINKEKPINDLKGVEQQLNKTGSAADNLIDTLKNVGLSIGFGKLLKDSLSLNSSFDALNNKFNSIFKGDFDGNVFAQLKEDITVSDSALKNILSTTGQFAAGMNQSSQFVRQFSADLTKAAADYATYQGKNTSSEINDYARKFAKATLGEVGELKEIGIVIDTTSKQFKNAVTEFAMLTGVTEAQAKQQIIFKEILEQTKIAASSAAGNINDGWAQLNKTFDVFKEILGEVGKIFSNVFGPMLSVLNSILEIPFVKSTTAWFIAIGSVSAAYVSMIKILRQLNSMLVKNNKIQSNMEVYKAQEKLLKLLKQQADAQAKLVELKRKLAEAENIIQNPRSSESKRRTANKFYYSSKESQDAAEASIARIDESIKSFGDVILQLNTRFNDSEMSLKDVIENIDGINDSFKNFVKSTLAAAAASNVSTTATTANTVAKTINTAATYGATAAEKVLAFARSNTSFLGSIKSIFGGIFKSILNFIKPIGLFFKGFFAKIVAGGVAKGLGLLTVALGKLLLVVSAVAGAVTVVFDSIKMLWNLVTGKEWNKGTITGWLANWGAGVDDAEKESKEIDEKIKKIMEPLKEIRNLKKELEDLQLERKIKDLLPSESIKIFEKRADELRNSITDAYARIEALKKDSRAKDDESLLNDKKDAQEKLLNLTKQLYETEDKISETRKKQIEIDKEYIKSMEEIRKKLYGISETFNYGYKNGKFGNYTEDAKYQNTLNSIDMLKKFDVSDTTEEGLKTTKEKLNEYFDLIKSKNEYELNALNKQREAAISTYEKTKEILNSISGYRVTAQTAISANSSEAIKLQSRRFESMTENRQLIQEQKQIKEIELRMLEKQKESKTTLEKIGNKLSEITNKIGKAQGANINIVPAL